MNKLSKTILPLVAALALGACETTVDSGGGGGGGGNIQPQPAPPPPLPYSVSSADNDTIEISSGAPTGSGPVRVCLTTNGGMWKKELRFDNGVVLRSENGTTDCAEIPAQYQGFEMVKAKFAGVMTGVGRGGLDLSRWNGARVQLKWAAD